MSTIDSMNVLLPRRARAFEPLQKDTFGGVCAPDVDALVAAFEERGADVWIGGGGDENLAKFEPGVAAATLAAAARGQRLAAFLHHDSEAPCVLPYGVPLFRASMDARARRPHEFVYPVCWYDPSEPPLPPAPPSDVPCVTFCGAVTSHPCRPALLEALRAEPRVRTALLPRVNFWNGALGDPASRAAFMSNLASGAFVACPRGAGNFSLRFYEALHAGRIPCVVLDDTVTLPFDDVIDWPMFVVTAPSVASLPSAIVEWAAARAAAGVSLEQAQAACAALYRAHLAPIPASRHMARQAAEYWLATAVPLPPRPLPPRPLPRMAPPSSVVVFWLRHLLVRGTEGAVYDYATGLEDELQADGTSGLAVVACTERTIKHWCDPRVFARFAARFPLLFILPDDLEDAASHLCTRVVRATVFYTLTHGKREYDALPRGVRTFVHAVFDGTEPHGDGFAVISDDMNVRQRTTAAVLPHMVTLPLRDAPIGDLRALLGIAETARVVGRMGRGVDNPDEVPWAMDALAAWAAAHPDDAVVCVNAVRPRGAPRNLHVLPSVADARDKQRFFNTCDAMLHMRLVGETFGLVVGEAAACGIPVLAYSGVHERAHLALAGAAVTTYDDAPSLRALLEGVTRRNGDAACATPGWGVGYQSREDVMATWRALVLRHESRPPTQRYVLPPPPVSAWTPHAEALGAHRPAPFVVYDVGGDGGWTRDVARVLWPYVEVQRFGGDAAEVSAAAARGDGARVHAVSLYELDKVVKQRALPPPDLIKLEFHGQHAEHAQDAAGRAAVVAGATAALLEATWLLVRIEGASAEALRLLGQSGYDLTDVLPSPRGPFLLMTRTRCASSDAPSAAAAASDVVVTRALWRPIDGGRDCVDATARVAAALAGGDVRATNALTGADPCVGIAKVLTVWTTRGSVAQPPRWVKEGEAVPL